MICTLVHGIHKHSGALVQSLKITEKIEHTKIMGMVSGVAQVAKVFTYGVENSGSVEGHGDLTLAPALGASTGISGYGTGLTLVDMVEYSEAITEGSKWTYNWTNFPHAA